MTTQTQPTPITACSISNMDYVRTMLAQIKYPNITIFFTWGGEKFTAAQSNDEKKEPCLRFKVNGMKFKGYVHIFYNWADYYRIEFVSTHRNLKNVADMVFADNLQSVIDEYVEKIDEYAF
jgi:hypothetical protein